MLIVADVHKIILIMKINDCNQLYISIATKAQIAPKLWIVDKVFSYLNFLLIIINENQMRTDLEIAYYGNTKRRNKCQYYNK